MDILGQSALLVSVVSFSLGLSVLARNTRNKLYLAFAGLCVVISAWAVAFFLEKIWPGLGFRRAHLILNVWLAPAGLGFTRFFVRLQSRVSRFLLDASVLAGALLSLALSIGFEQTAPIVLQLAYFFPGLIVIQILQLMWIDLRVRRGKRVAPKAPAVGLARSRDMIYLGALVVLSTCVMDHVSWVGPVVASLGNILLSVYLYFLSQAISQQRLLNFPALVSRFLVLVMVALILTLVYSVLVAWIKDSPALFFLNSFIVSMLVVLLLEPIRALVSYFTRRMLTQENLRLERVLRESHAKLAGIVDPASLFQAVAGLAEQTLHPQWIALFTLRSDGTRFVRARSQGQAPQGAEFLRGHPLPELLAGHELIGYCAMLRKKGAPPILLDQVFENEVDRSASRTQREHFRALLAGLRALGGNLLVPLYDGETMLGFVMMSVPSPPEPWGGSWGLLPVIYPYFEEAARALRNMEVYVRSREKERLATIGEMAAGLAHEIRNPLGAIKGAAQFLDPSAERPESRFLRVIVEEVDRLNRVVTQFLDYSKPPAGDFKPVDVSLIAEKTIDLLKPSLAPDQVDRVAFQPSPRPARVLAAPEQIQQVILNLVQNGLNALQGRAGGQVRVSVGPTRDGGEREVQLTVEDNGPGIRKEHLDKLFIPFFTTSPQGTGLGLSICQKIVEAHRGRIEVESEEGKFARFSVVLPVAGD